MKTSVKLAVICCTAALLASGCVTSGSHTLSITEALNSKEAKASLDPSIKLEFAAGKGTVLRDGQVSNKKEAASDKTLNADCIRTFVSAVKQLQEEARRAGATKVINIISYYRKKPYSSASLYDAMPADSGSCRPERRFGTLSEGFMAERNLSRLGNPSTCAG